MAEALDGQEKPLGEKLAVVWEEIGKRLDELVGRRNGKESTVVPEARSFIMWAMVEARSQDLTGDSLTDHEVEALEVLAQMRQAQMIVGRLNLSDNERVLLRQAAPGGPYAETSTSQQAKQAWKTLSGLVERYGPESLGESDNKVLAALIQE